jgi:hypothetical protein
MSATGSVNLIVCFSFSHPFAPRPFDNRGEPAAARFHQPFMVNPSVVRRASIAMHGQRPPTTSYQDDFDTPGISPRNASCRKHSRQIPNLRRNARGRPQSLQRLCLRVENLGFFTLLWCNPTLSLTRFAVVPTYAPEFFAQNFKI